MVNDRFIAVAHFVTSDQGGGSVEDLDACSFGDVERTVAAELVKARNAGGVPGTLAATNLGRILDRREEGSFVVGQGAGIGSRYLRLPVSRYRSNSIRLTPYDSPPVVAGG